MRGLHMCNFKNMVIQRWKYFLACYLFGYIIPLIMDGIPNVYYLIPLKVVALVIGFILGNCLYIAKTEKPTVFRMLLISTKYAIPAVVLLILSILAQQYIYRNYGTDIGFIIGVKAN